MVRWLEADGYDVSYFTSVDADRNGGAIGNHKVYLSAGLDEYASGARRGNIEAAREQGVNLAFFSGGEFFWKSRWENSIDGADTPYRTLVCYRETLNGVSPGSANPSVWTGTWRDPFSPPDDGRRPENAFTARCLRSRECPAQFRLLLPTQECDSGAIPRLLSWRPKKRRFFPLEHSASGGMQTSIMGSGLPALCHCQPRHMRLAMACCRSWTDVRAWRGHAPYGDVSGSKRRSGFWRRNHSMVMGTRWESQ